MGRLFINQTGDSNKFWRIEQTDNSYTVTWGKIGTDGRTNDKTFSSADDCGREVEKLIKEKISKGYHEVSDYDSIPDKPIQEYKPMEEGVFWEIISSFVAKPVIVFSSICLIIVINAAVIFSSTSFTNSTDQQNNELATADEYNLVSAPMYEYVNAKP